MAFVSGGLVVKTETMDEDSVATMGSSRARTFFAKYVCPPFTKMN